MERMDENQLVQFRRENVGFIFQSYNLLKTLNAVENVALPLSFRGVPKKIRNARAEEYLKLVGLEKQMKHMANAMLREHWSWIPRSSLRMNRPETWILRRPWRC